MKIADRPAGASRRFRLATWLRFAHGSHGARPLISQAVLRDPAPPPSRGPAWLAILVALPLALSGCGSLFDEGAAAGAGVVGATVASKLTASAAVTSGISLGALAAAQSGAKYVEKRAHQQQQDTIAQRAGPLAPGQVADWQFDPRVKLEPEQHGRVTVSRVIAAQGLDCKEIVFSVDTVMHQVKTQPITASSQGSRSSDGWLADQATHQAPRDHVQTDSEPISAFYVATICRDGANWKWASAEPATERWGALQ